MPKKLLLADDSITIQKVVGITLANEDLEITSVDNGEDAITRAKTLRPDLVLADASMPKKDGYQVAEALKADPTTSMIPVLILAGQLEGHPDQGRLAACKADGFIPKPFESQQLIDRVRKLLGLAGPVSVAVPAPAPAIRPAAAAPVAAAAVGGVRNAPVTAPAPVAAPRPAPVAAPVAAPTPIAATTRPAPVAAPIAAPRPAPVPAPAPAPVPMAAASTIDEADFGELSSSPAASGDTSLWGDAPVGTVPDEALWGGTAPSDTPTNGAPAAIPPTPPMAMMPIPDGNGLDMGLDDDPMDMVTNPAEMANLDKFHGDDSPSGLELDPDAPKARPRVGDDQLSTGPVPGAPVPTITPAPQVAATVGVNPDLATAIALLPPEKLEQIVREAVAAALKPIIEKIAWEVVPDLAEDLIKDEIKRLTQ